MSAQRVQSHFAAKDGLWSYEVTLDGASVASGSGYTAENVMRTHLDRDVAAQVRNLESAAAVERFKAERRLAVVLLAHTAAIATAATPLVRLLLKLPAHVELAVVLPYGEVPEGLIVVGFVSIGLDFSTDRSLHHWVNERVIPQVGRGGIFFGFESDVTDLVPPGGKRSFPFHSL